MANQNENRIEIIEMIHEKCGKILFLENAKQLAANGTLQNVSSEIEFHEKGFDEIWNNLIFKGYKASVEQINQAIKKEEKGLMTLISTLKGAKK